MEEYVTKGHAGWLKFVRHSSMRDLAKSIGEWRRWKGFNTVIGLTTPELRTLTMEKLMLAITEIAEAAEAVRHEDVLNFREEIADAFIRLFDIVDAAGIDIEHEIAEKRWPRTKSGPTCTGNLSRGLDKQQKL